MGKCAELGMSPCSSNTRIILVGKTWTTYKNAWKKLMLLSDLAEPTSICGHVYLGCAQRECKSNENIFEEYKTRFGSRISAGVTEKLLGCEELHAKTAAWSYDMEGHGKKCVERYCDLANKKTEQMYRVSTP